MTRINKPAHAAQHNFPTVNGCLQIGGMPLTRLAQRVGMTPFYAYDRALLTARVAQLRAALPREISLHYSVKANPMPALVQWMAGLVDGFDVASGGELATVLDTTMPPAAISFAGPGKSLAELRRAVAAGVVIHAESEREINTLADLGQTLGLKPKVSLRINPDFELKSSGMKMGGGAKPFGVDAELAPALLARLATLDVEFHGLQIFSGSQSLDAQAVIDAQSSAFALAFRLAQHAPSPLRSLNIGGGFGIPYFPGDQHLDLAPIGEHLQQWMPRVQGALPDVEVVLELGRYLVGEAGLYVTRVVDRKESRGKVFLVVDGGLHHHLAASGNFGQVIRKNYPVAPALSTGAADEVRETVSVVGPLCTPLDVLAAQMELPRAEAGDLIVVFQSGAYGLSASPTAFLGHPAPAEVLV
jgi:diaminopimelate decarboxylase